MSRSLSIPLAALWLAVCAAQALSQNAPATVTGTGTSAIELRPERMRMHVELSASAAKLKDALTALGDRRAAAEAQLAAMGADKKSIQFGEVAIRDAATDRQRQLQQMMRARLGQRGAKTSSPPPTLQSVGVSLTAEWPLPKGTHEALLLAVHEIQTKVDAADLAGTKQQAKAASPEEQELLEEATVAPTGNYGEEAPQPGKPEFAFVAKVAEADREKALAAAFAKAKAQAARTAKAAGASLGALVGVSDQTGGAMSVGDDEYGNYNQRVYYSRMQQQAMASGGAAEDEAISARPGKITGHVSVSAVFGLK